MKKFCFADKLNGAGVKQTFIREPSDKLKCVKEDPKNEFLCAGFWVVMSALPILLARFPVRSIPLFCGLGWHMSF
jgi:hypothetical protein